MAGVHETVTYLTAFGAGVLSFLSPCVLPLVPSFVSYLTGLSVEELTSAANRRHVRWLGLSHAAAFIAGFSLIFIVLGASATSLGQLVAEHQTLLRKIGGALITCFGLFLTGLVPLPWLNREAALHIRHKPAGWFGSGLMGVAFAVGWSPCIGPVLASILTIAATTEHVWRGVALLSAYSLGLGVPFLMSAWALDRFLLQWAWFKRYMRWMSWISGAFLMLVGVMVYTGAFAFAAGYLTSLFQRV